MSTLPFNVDFSIPAKVTGRAPFIIPEDDFISGTSRVSARAAREINQAARRLDALSPCLRKGIKPNTTPFIQHLIDSYHYDKVTGKITHKKDAPKKSYHNPYKAGDEIRVSYIGQGDYRYPRMVTTFQGKQKHVALHRLVYILINHKEPSGYIDHVKGNTLSYHHKGLRNVTPSQNSMNAFCSKDSQVNYKGVTRAGKKFRARLFCEGVARLDEKFDSASEAAKRYDEVARLYFGDFGKYNFPRTGERSAIR
ncbi:TPA: hypothetical protein RRU21_001617 [Klebsiella pneumoniae]|nr:hypothetical protein [Klebsiella pneumoniae]